MRRFLSVTATGLATIVIVVGALPVRASIEVAPVAFGSSSFPDVFPEMLSLPQFNTENGSLTLTGVSIELTASLEPAVVNFGPAATFTAATASGTTELTGLPGASLSVSLSTAPLNGSIGAGSFTSPAIVYGQSASISASDSATIASADIGAYENPGPGNQDILFDADFTGSYSGGGDAGLFFGGLASGIVDVTYTYDNNAIPQGGPVPEAGTIWGALCVLGYGAFALRGRFLSLCCAGIGRGA